MTQMQNDEYSARLFAEAEHLIAIHCPRSAQARVRRIARHDADVYGLDYGEALVRRQGEFYERLFPDG